MGEEDKEWTGFRGINWQLLRRENVAERKSVLSGECWEETDYR